MALIEYKCAVCGGRKLVFSGEENLRLSDKGCFEDFLHLFEALPPDPTVVHCTNTYMSEPQLDSLKTVYELDRQLNIEAAEEREMKAYNMARINV